jgi:cyclophilin family peptidyl-prolyl cis-trans isomerase
VRREVIAAIGAVPSLDRPALLEPLTDAAAAPGARGAVQAAIEAGEAVRALGRADLLRQPARFLDPARPTEVRVAAVEVSADRAALLALALKDGEVAVRSAAAARALELDLTTDQRLALVGAFDPIVAAMGAAALAERPAAALERPLLAALKEAENPDLVAALLKALLGLVEGDKPAVKKPDPGVAAAARAHLAHPSGPVRAAAGALAAALRLSTPPAPTPELPPADLSQIRSARVRTNRGEVLLALNPEEAPITVWNFAKLAEAGWYDGLRFHRVVPDFVVQTGDPRGDGNGGPAWTIPDENNPLSYQEGVLGMALSGPDTGGSQWFITLSPQPHLDGDYTAFGEVLQGMPVVRSLQPGDYIERVTIERVAPRADPDPPRPGWVPEAPTLQQSPGQTSP